MSGNEEQGLTDSTAPPAWHGPQCPVPQYPGVASPVGAEAELWGNRVSGAQWMLRGKGRG